MATQGIAYPLINGTRHEWSSIEIQLAPEGKGSNIYVGVKELAYKLEMAPTDVYGTSPQPIGRTRGVLSFSASLTLYKAESALFLQQLGDGYLEKPFNVIANYTENGFDTITDSIIGCRLVSPDNSHSQGADPLVVKWDLHPMMIKLSGLNPLAQMLQGQNP